MTKRKNIEARAWCDYQETIIQAGEAYNEALAKIDEEVQQYVEMKPWGSVPVWEG